jgi:hypothetical protein
LSRCKQAVVDDCGSQKKFWFLVAGRNWPELPKSMRSVIFVLWISCTLQVLAAPINCGNAYMDIGAGTNYTYKFFSGWSGKTFAAARTYCQGLCTSGCNLAQGRFNYSVFKMFAVLTAGVGSSGGGAYIGMNRTGTGSGMTWFDGRTCNDVVSDVVCYGKVNFDQSSDVGGIYTGFSNVYDDMLDNYASNAICEIPGILFFVF